MKRAGKRDKTTKQYTNQIINKEYHHKHTHTLLYFVTFLLILLILAIILSYPLYNKTTEQEGVTLAIDSVTCAWKETQYQICESISWKGSSNSYVKPYIPGGEQLENIQPYYANQFTYCQPVGSEDGYRIVRAILYTSGNIQKDIGEGVSCENKPEEQTISLGLQRPKNHVETGQFIVSVSPTVVAQPSAWLEKSKQIQNQNSVRSGRSYAEGYYKQQFPGIVASCTIKGNWVTNNDAVASRQRNYCHDAKGTFEGYADGTQQYVVNDPSYFQWEGESKPKVDPRAQTHQGNILFMNTCGNDYYTHLRYYVKATATGFGTNEITLNWNYFDDETRPQINFNFELDCTLQD